MDTPIYAQTKAVHDIACSPLDQLIILRRHNKCASGDHSACSMAYCEGAVPVISQGRHAKRGKRRLRLVK